MNSALYLREILRFRESAGAVVDVLLDRAVEPRDPEHDRRDPPDEREVREPVGERVGGRVAQRAALRLHQPQQDARELLHEEHALRADERARERVAQRLDDRRRARPRRAARARRAHRDVHELRAREAREREGEVAEVHRAVGRRVVRLHAADRLHAAHVRRARDDEHQPEHDRARADVHAARRVLADHVLGEDHVRDELRADESARRSGVRRGGARGARAGARARDDDAPGSPPSARASRAARRRSCRR